MRKSESPATLIAAFDAIVNKDHMRGFNRALTLYCRRRSAETGKPEYMYRAGIKAALRKRLNSRMVDLMTSIFGE